MNEEQDQQSRVFSELSSLIHGLLKCPSSCTSSSSGSVVITPIQSNRQVSAAGFASLLLGVSLALMLCGSVTFVIGFILMPWLLGIVLVFYLVGVVSALSNFGRDFLYPPPPSTKQIPEWNFWDPVYCVSFSPNGEFLASGSLGKCLHIWSVKEGRIVKTYEGSSSIFEVSWNKEGTKVATCSANRVYVMDVRM